MQAENSFVFLLLGLDLLAQFVEREDGLPLLYSGYDLFAQVETPLVAFLAEAVRVVLAVLVFAADLRLLFLCFEDGRLLPRWQAIYILDA